MDLNSILEGVGTFGHYQQYLCIFLVLPTAFICALLYFTQFFIILVPPHHCFIELDNTSLQITDFIPIEVKNGKSVLNNCYEFREHLSNTSLQKCINGWHYDYTSLYPTMASESNWVCDDDRQPFNIQTLFYCGTSIGSLLFGYISDKFGRRPSIILSSLLALIGGIGTAFAFDFWSFAALRFLVGMTIIPLSEDPYVLSLEYMGVEKRTFPIITWTIGYISASIICPWMAYLLQSWRALCIITSFPLLLLVFCSKLIPESATWLITQGKTERAVKMLAKTAKINKKKSVDELNIMECLLTHSSNNSKGVLISVLNIFKMKRMRVRTIILAIIWFILFTCYHTNTQNTSSFGSDIYMSFTLGAVMEIGATIFVYLTLDRWGRKWPLLLCMLISGSAGISTFFFEDYEKSKNFYLLITLIMRVSLAAEYSIVIQYSTEVYPTVLRGRSLAFLRFIGTLGLYLSPSIVYLNSRAHWMPLVITGFMTIMAAFLSFFLPETMNQNLPHTLQEGEDFGRNQRIIDISCLKCLKVNEN